MDVIGYPACIMQPPPPRRDTAPLVMDVMGSYIIDLFKYNRSVSCLYHGYGCNGLSCLYYAAPAARYSTAAIVLDIIDV